MNKTRSNTIDALRGIGLFLIFFNHLGILFYTFKPIVKITNGLFGYCSFAEIFLMISAYVLVQSFPSSDPEKIKGRGTWLKASKRFLRLYSVYLLLLTTVILFSLFAPWNFRGLAEIKHYDPLRSFILGLFFLFQPDLLDILPIYALLAFFNPIIILAFTTKRSKTFLFFSFLTWLSSQIFILPKAKLYNLGVVFPYFNIFAWQFYYSCLVFLYLSEQRIKPYFSKILIFPILICLSCFLLRHNLIPLLVPNQLTSRMDIGLLRLINSLAFAFLALTLKRFSFNLPPIFAFYGRHSLLLFSLHLIIFYISKLFINYNFRTQDGLFQVLLYLFFFILPFIVLHLLKKNQLRWPNLLFLIAFSLLPVAIIKGSLRSYADIKILFLVLLSAVCALDLILSKKILIVPKYFFLLFIFFLLQTPFLNAPINLGIHLQFLSITLSSLIIGIWLVNSKISFEHISFFLLFPLIVTLFSALSMAIFRISFFSDYSPFGAPIGLKNSLSVFLAANLISLLLLKGQTFKSSKRFFSFLIFLLGALSTWIIIINRTRSAWWMLIILVMGLALLSLPIKDFKPYFIKALSMILGGVLFSFAVPTKLQWSSDTPFLDSLNSLTDIYQSNGRNELWTVGFEIFKKNLFFGVGTSNYSPLWPSYIVTSEVNAKIFAFLRPDLPLFNDYLQVFVENGIFAGILFIYLKLIYPFYALIKHRDNPYQAIPLLGCLLLAANAFFDYPFYRAETSLLFICFLGLALKKAPEPSLVKVALSVKILSSVFLLFTFYLVTMLGSALYHRRAYVISSNYYHLKKSWAAWPYDMDWNRFDVKQILDKKDLIIAEHFANLRLKLWPNDSESSLIKALVEESKGDLVSAKANLERSLIKIKGGNCFWPGVQEYRNFKIRHPELKYTEKDIICK